MNRHSDVCSCFVRFHSRRENLPFVNDATLTQRATRIVVFGIGETTLSVNTNRSWPTSSRLFGTFIIGFVVGLLTAGRLKSRQKSADA